MSILDPMMSEAITEHSMCQPGRPPPHGESHAGSPALDAFHSAKSDAERFSPAPAVCVPSDSAISASVALPLLGSSLGYACPLALYAAMSMYTDPFDSYASPLAMIPSTKLTILGTYSVTRVRQSGVRMLRDCMSFRNSASYRRACASKISCCVTAEPFSASRISASASDAASMIAPASAFPSASSASTFAFVAANVSTLCCCCCRSSLRSSSSRLVSSGTSRVASFFFSLPANVSHAAITSAFNCAGDRVSAL
mmetsp:Transcript_43713/g.114896  ORF Transcript_43713/g.114896 Transcript_43713/m.114896 type:complete len:254 (-) Transcript_43713:563-1324(-)